MDFWAGVRKAASDPWLALASAFVGGAGWAANIVAAPPAVVIAGGVFAAGAAAGGLLNRGGEREAKPVRPELRPGTPQAGLVDQLGRYVRDLELLRGTRQPDALVDLTIEALAGARNAYATGGLVAAAVDGLDTALARSAAGTPSTNPEVKAAVARMQERRQGLLGRLRNTVDEVAIVYTKLLEMSAAVSSFDVGSGAVDDVTRVSETLDSLRSNLSELEAQARPRQ